jgi:outer membrane protein OmpA-like peptidoglycan-associated protein
VKVWLTNHGMDPARIDAVGYSEARPRCDARTDGCPSHIRRDEFLIVAGADVFVRASP